MEDPYEDAVYHSDVDLLNELYSKGVRVIDPQRLASDAASSGIEVRDWLLEHFPETAERLFTRVFENAISNLNDRDIEWLKSKGYQPDQREIDSEVTESLQDDNYDQLAFMTRHGYVRGIVDLSKGDYTEAAKLGIAYVDSKYPYPRYPRTGHPVSEMPFAGNHCRIGEFYLPVIRYESLFYNVSGTGNGTCGTFYFYEPDSTSFLNLGKVLIAANKIDAMIKLDPTGGEVMQAILRLVELTLPRRRS